MLHLASLTFRCSLFDYPSNKQAASVVDVDPGTCISSGGDKMTYVQQHGETWTCGMTNVTVSNSCSYGGHGERLTSSCQIQAWLITEGRGCHTNACAPTCMSLARHRITYSSSVRDHH